MRILPALLLCILHLPPDAFCKESKTNLISIYLAETILHRDARALNKCMDGTIRTKEIALQPSAILTEADLVSYNKETHSFRLGAEAAKRLSKALRPDQNSSADDPMVLLHCFDGPDRAFVLYVRDQPIYVGVFSSVISSTLYAVPTVYAQRLVFPATSNDALQFTVGPGLPRASHTDQRSDARLLAALKELGW